MPFRKLALLLPLLLAGGVAWWLSASGGLDRLALWAAEGQRDAQNAIARSVRALRQGEAGALSLLLGVSFLYGLFHAAGPGHGKILIGGYGMGRAVPAVRLAGLALLSSLAQSATAVALVAAGMGVLSWSRIQVTGLADGILSIASYLAVAGIGLWLAIRGLRNLRRSAPNTAPDQLAHTASAQGTGPSHDHMHTHDDAICAHCGHAHGPTPDQAGQVTSLRDAVLLIGAVAIRPCTGALFLLIITWRMGIAKAGIAGAFAMGLGTASITILAALASVWLRQASVDRLRKALPDAHAAARLAAMIELSAGALVAFLALSLALRLI